ncbi:DUF1007 family protein [Arcobacter porcinus]|uniref:Nickel/cobalt efflux system n=1 Tax=Arcobacter porcinus TaxID=1935204 RepID=A0A5C2HGD9_9BACT|nr:DUF1007 family protein [Arcobacter porcinus]OCL91301.1 nickel/cobalt efflux protein RcnA [Aliarcobacter thereius]QEP40381.1 metal ion ABC transporter, permease protein [Arcobacter porcinus]
MIRLILFLVLSQSFIFGCSLCAVLTPKTFVTTKIEADDKNIKSVDIKWEFVKEFSEELMKIYDLNLDNNFDEKELALIEDSLISYLVSKDFLTTISYSNKGENSIPFRVESYKMSFINNTLFFDYKIILDLEIYDQNSLNIRIFDDENYFFFIFEDKNQYINIPYEISKKTKINDVNYKISASNLSSQKFNIVVNSKKEEKQSLEDIWIENNQKVEEKDRFDNKVKSVETKEISFTEKFTNSMKKHLVDIENGDKFALFFLILASFLYGLFHALGPGHGKALAFSYFSTQKSTYFEAFTISFLTAFIHIIGALLIVVFSILILNTLMSNFLEESVTYITAFSAIIIMLLAVFILYRKITKKSCVCGTCGSNEKLKCSQFSIKPQNMNFVKATINKPIRFEKRSKKQDLIFVLTAGIIPCPGTVLLFVYAFYLKTYFAVAIASISVSFGMALVIFSSSFLGVSLHKLSSNSKKLVNSLEILAPIFMFVLALLMLIGVLI